MKKSFLYVLLLVFSFGTSLMAQEYHHGHKKDKGEMIEMMKKKLDLTDQQVNEIKAIAAKYKDQEEALKSKMKSLHGEFKKLREQKKSEIDKVFNAEQKAKIQKMKAERKKRKGEYHKKM